MTDLERALDATLAPLAPDVRRLAVQRTIQAVATYLRAHDAANAYTLGVHSITAHHLITQITPCSTPSASRCSSP